ncbi:MAG TPA: PAS domain S-box protein, partial [Gaiellaceae bacterium]|nr:PAS domain S-box protein [Gaiellaceae bacterium]
LEESESRFRSAFDQAAVGMMLTDAGGVLIRANAAFARMLGYPADDLVGRPVQELTFPDDAPLTKRNIELMRSGGTDAVVTDKRYVRADGGIVWGHVGVSVVRDRDGTPVQFVAQVEDVTEFRRLERELAETQALHEVVIESSPDLIAVLGLDGTIRLVSRSAEQILGYAPDQLVGCPVSDVFTPEDIDGVNASFAAALAGEPSALGDSHVRTRDGRIRVVSGTVSAGLDAAGNPAFIVLNGRDVTGQRRLEEQLRQAQRMEAVGNLAGGIAHDFNNLLTAINGYSDLARAAVSDGDAVVGSHLEEIRRAGERAADLTRQLLAFSRQQLLQPELVDLNEVVSGYVTMLQRLVREDIRLHVDLHPDLPPVLADPTQLGQVLLNLVVNARDAMPAGGDLRIATSCAVDGDTRCVVLTVADTGVGIAPEVAERIFEPFYTTKPPGRGTGMGLSTVHGVVEQSGGAVSVESRQGAGATFVVCLPAVDGTPACPDVAVAADGGDNHATILLVEDDTLVRGIVTEMLERLGHEVVVAATPGEALELALGPAELDLVLTDVVMPEMNGHDLALRLAELRPGLRIVYTSGYPCDAVRDRGVLDARDTFLQKPFTMTALAAALRPALR